MTVPRLHDLNEGQTVPGLFLPGSFHDTPNLVREATPPFGFRIWPVRTVVFADNELVDKVSGKDPPWWGRQKYLEQL